MVVHEGGGVSYGHYYSFVKGPDDRWRKCNDEYVSNTNLETALNQQAYVLFYKKRHSTKEILSSPSIGDKIALNHNFSN